MADTRVQEKTAVTGAGGASSITATFDTGPTQGNLLVAIGTSDTVITMNSSGWTAGPDATSETGTRAWWKVAGASEASAVQISGTGTTSIELYVVEWSLAGTGTPTLDDSATQVLIGGSTGGTGTVDTTVDDALLIAGWGWNNNPTTFPTADSYSNSFAERAELTGLVTTATQHTRLAIADRQAGAAGSYSCTVTLSASHAADKHGLLMAFRMAPPTLHPVVAATEESSVNTAGTSHAVTLPAGGASTDLYLITMDIGSTSATLNALTDWGEILDESAANGLKILWYTGAGVPSNPTFTSSASTRSASIAWRITGADKTITPDIGTTATGTSTTPDPPNVSGTGGSKDYLFVTFFGGAGEEVDDDTWSNTPPTDYEPSPPLQKACGTAGSSLGGKIAAASRRLTAASANPGTFAQDVSTAWRAQTIAIHPAPVVAGAPDILMAPGLAV